MLSAWTKHLKDPEEIKRFKNNVQGSKTTLDRLKQLLDEEIDRLDRSETDIKSYDIPNWDYRQAHKNGFRQYHQIITKLINLDQKEPQ